MKTVAKIHVTEICQESLDSSLEELMTIKVILFLITMTVQITKSLIK